MMERVKIGSKWGVLWLAVMLALPALGGAAPAQAQAADAGDAAPAGRATPDRAADEAAAAAEVEKARELLGAWAVDEARPVVERLLAVDPGSPEALDLAALLAYYEGDYDKALQTVEKALALDAEAGAEAEQRQALRLHLQQTRDVTAEFRRYESDHFVLHLHEESDGILVEPALAALEKAHREVGRALGYWPRGKARIEIAPDSRSFMAITTFTRRDIEETGAIGLCKFNKVMALSPRVTARGYRWLDSLAHEYIHLAIVHLTRNKTPIWLHEGIARYYETVWRNPMQDEFLDAPLLRSPLSDPGSEAYFPSMWSPDAGARPDYLTPANETLLATAVERQEFVSFKDMEPSLIRLETPEQVQLAYAEAASAVDFIRRTKGRAGIRELLSLVNRLSTAEAIEAVMGLPMDGFETTWRTFVETLGLTVVQGSRMRTYKLAEEGGEPAVVELDEIQSEIARNRTHLGDRLRERGRLRAASAEYRRALRAGPNSTVILNRLGETLIQSRRYDEALPHLEKAGYLDPDAVHTYYLKGQIHHATGEHARARDALREALEINPFHPGVYSVLSQVYEAVGDDAGVRKTREVMRRLRG